MKALTWFAAAALTVGLAAPATAQTAQRFALIVEGAPGDQPHADLQRRLVASLTARFRDEFKLDAEHLVLLTSTPVAGEGKATAVDVRAAVAKLAPQVKPLDVFFVLLVGHGSFDGVDAKFNLVGPDLTATEWSLLLKPVAFTEVVFAVQSITMFEAASASSTVSIAVVELACTTLYFRFAVEVTLSLAGHLNGLRCRARRPH